MTLDIAIARNRFGYGAVSGGGAKLTNGAEQNPQQYLLKQIDDFDAAPSLIKMRPQMKEIVLAFGDYREAAQMARRVDKKAADTEKTMLEDARKESRAVLRRIYMADVNTRLELAVTSDQDFAERLVHFWSNHFAISVDKRETLPFAGNYEFMAIRPNIAGKFSDLLLAAVTHPTMLLYLDQASSIGPNSRLAERVNARRKKRKLGLNENLAREILELHTLGDKTIYDQNDVTELARGLTGWTVSGMLRGPLGRRVSQQAEAGELIYINTMHEPGKRKILGRSYPDSGRKLLRSILSDLATHPATARFISTKLARHFVSDTPPESLIKKLENDYLKTGGDLSSLYRTLIAAKESWPTQWMANDAKYKSPWDWTVSMMRALDIRDLGNRRSGVTSLRNLGQAVWQPGSPAGFADMKETWTGAAALMRRFEMSRQIARRVGGEVDARMLAPEILPHILTENTRTAIARAESPQQGLALLLISPEFMRR